MALTACGNIWTGITDQALDPEACRRWLADPSHGAQLSFFGVIRNHNQGRAAIAVSYDVYEPLANQIFNDLCRTACDRWGSPLRIVLLHRSGRLSIGEVSVAIAVGSPHRDEAYQASRFLIEAVKHQAPIWKKEHYPDGDSEWVQGHSLCQY
jgi:molybdopterin synthase catalytic subunit